MSTPPLSYLLEENIAVVRMDDGKANALSEPMIDALGAALVRAEKEAKAMLLVGRAERFCAGFDLKVMMSGPEPAKALLRRGADLLMNLYGAKIPLVIACTGHAVAGGALLLLTGDARFGATGAFRIGLNEVSIGLPVPVLAMDLARDRLSPRVLSRATLLSTLYSPEDAVVAGYLDETTLPDALIARATEEARRLGELPRGAFYSTKERLRGATIAHVRETLESDLKSLLSAS